MIEMVKTDLLNSTIPLFGIVQCNNCFGVQGAGIALQIVRKFPKVLEDDKAFPYSAKERLGNFCLSAVNSEDSTIKYVGCLYAQYRYGRGERHLNYEALYTSFFVFCESWNRRFTNKCFGIPYKMGCNLAGGNWNIVYAILNECVNEFGLKAVICQKD
jgi:O-acetyl-ADP-ribose deacetylase (regulator of RNase III)